MPLKNKLTDLNNVLFAQLERLSDEGISQKELDMEIERSKAISSIASNIINNAKTMLLPIELKMKHGGLQETKDIPDPFKIIENK